MYDKNDLPCVSFPVYPPRWKMIGFWFGLRNPKSDNLLSTLTCRNRSLKHVEWKSRMTFDRYIATASRFGKNDCQRNAGLSRLSVRTPNLHIASSLQVLMNR